MVCTVPLTQPNFILRLICLCSAWIIDLKYDRRWNVKNCGNIESVARVERKSLGVSFYP
jgi:hypothetical protein